MNNSVAEMSFKSKSRSRVNSEITLLHASCRDFEHNQRQTTLSRKLEIENSDLGTLVYLYLNKITTKFKYL